MFSISPTHSQLGTYPRSTTRPSDDDVPARCVVHAFGGGLALAWCTSQPRGTAQLLSIGGRRRCSTLVA